MMAGHLLHSGGEGGIGEERQELQSETSVSYWSRLADRLIVTGIQSREGRQREANGNISYRWVCLWAESRFRIIKLPTCFLFYLSLRMGSVPALLKFFAAPTSTCKTCWGTAWAWEMWLSETRTWVKKENHRLVEVWVLTSLDYMLG